MRLQPQESEEKTADLPHVHIGRNAKEGITENGEELRVTPEEVALAAAALEARRDAEHAWRETTLPLDEAIHQLGLNATPQDLAPEVRSLRVQRATKTRQEQIQQRTRRVAWIVGTTGLVCLLAIVGVLWSSLSKSRLALHNVQHTMVTLPIQKLASIPENTPVHIDSDTLAELAKGDVKPENVSVDTRIANSEGTQSATMFNNEWTVVKSGGTLVVGGWATAEFALNISNDDTGGLFSSRPGWLPANNLVPIQVPVYRLEGQPFARYLPDGKEATSAVNSVLMAVDVADSSTAVKDLVAKDILHSDENFTYENSTEGYSSIEVSVSDKVVRLTGNATADRLKKLAGEVAARTLQRLHVADTISNELKIAQKDQ